MFEETEIFKPAASQLVATSILAPCFVGWALQFLLCGIATDRAIKALRRKRHDAQTMDSGVPYTRTLLTLAMLGDICSAASAIWNIGIYALSIDRTAKFFMAYKIPDVTQTAFAVFSSAGTQIFMATRCYRICGRSKIFAIFATLGIILCSGSIIAGAICMRKKRHVTRKEERSQLTYHFAMAWTVIGLIGTGPSQSHFIPSQIGLWSSLLLDLLITSVLTVSLLKLRRQTRSQSRTDSFISSLIVLALETCALPTILVMLTALMFIATLNSPLLYTLHDAPLYMIPPIYLLTFVYCLEATVRKRNELHEARLNVHITQDLERGNRIAQSLPGVPNNTPAADVAVSLGRKEDQHADNSGSSGSRKREEKTMETQWLPPDSWGSSGGHDDGVIALATPSLRSVQYMPTCTSEQEADVELQTRHTA